MMVETELGRGALPSNSYNQAGQGKEKEAGNVATF